MKPDAQVIARTCADLLALGGTRGPIVVGPWLSEVGFELLYWIPFLRWAKRFAGLHTEDLIVISRGGAGAWYQDLGAQYLDVLDFYSPEQFRAHDDERIKAQAARYVELGLRKGTLSPKQQIVSEFDRAILKRAGLSHARLLHPSLMYRYFRPYWRGQNRAVYERSLDVQRLRPTEGGSLNGPSRLGASLEPTNTGGEIVGPQTLHLPSQYVAMKFYSSAAVPDTTSHRRLVQETVATVARMSDVVLLHRQHSTDDHKDFGIDAGPRVHVVELPAAQNLDIQTSVIAGASQFIGTYGGFSYLAPLLGVPTMALYAKENFRRDHRHLMAKAAKALSVPFDVQPLARGLGQLQAKAVRRAA